MKKYIGTKVIEAESMTLEEAQKLLCREIKPATIESDGYLVKYEDGYMSWSPKSVFEAAYMPAETVLDRLYIEYSELKKRFTELNDALCKEGF